MAGRPKGGAKFGGREKGTPNKVTAALKDMILEAAELAGGEGGTVAYLKKQAMENPTSFNVLLGKVLPTQVTADLKIENVDAGYDEFAGILGEAARDKQSGADSAENLDTEGTTEPTNA